MQGFKGLGAVIVGQRGAIDAAAEVAGGVVGSVAGFVCVHPATIRAETRAITTIRKVVLFITAPPMLYQINKEKKL
jgi:hypothetical protein